MKFVPHTPLPLRLQAWPDFALFNVAHASLPTAAAPMLASWFYQSYISFVLHSFLYCCVGDDLQYMLWLQCKTWVSSMLAGALLMFFAWNVTQSIQRSELESK